MDGESASFSWNGLFPEIDHTDKFDDFGLPVSPVFQVMMPQEFQDPVNRRSQGGKKTTNNGSTYTFLVHNEHTESQKANAMKRRPVKSGGQGKVSGSSRKNKSAVGESSLDVSTLWAEWYKETKADVPEATENASQTSTKGVPPAKG